MKKNILVVDDQPGIRLLLEDVLTHEGYQVATCTTGAEALDKLQKRSFDLVVMDYKLPVMDGVEVIKQMESEDIRVPAVLISGLAEEMGKELEDSSLIEAIIPKPFNVQHMTTVVKSIFS